MESSILYKCYITSPQGPVYFKSDPDAIFEWQDYSSKYAVARFNSDRLIAIDRSDPTKPLTYDGDDYVVISAIILPDGFSGQAFISAWWNQQRIRITTA